MRPITESLIFAIAYCVFAIAALSITSVMIAPLQASFNINYMQIAWLISAFAYPYIFMQLPMGWLMDKIGATSILRVVALFASLGCVWFAFAGSYYEVLLARAFTGAAASVAIPAALYIAANGFSPKYFVVLVGVVETSATLSAGLSEPLFAHLFSKYPWQQVVLGLGMIGFGLTAMMWWRLPGRRVIFAQHAAPYTVSNHHEPAAVYSKRERWQIIFSSKVLLNGVISGVLFGMVMFFGGLWSIPMLEQVYGLAHERAAWTGCISLLGAALGGPLIGYIATTERRQLPLLLAGSIFAAFLTVLLLNGVVANYLLVVVMFALGVAVSVYVIPYAIVKNRTPGALSGTVMAVVNLITGGVGALLLVPAVGYLVDGPSGPHLLLDEALRVFPLSLLLICVMLLFLEKKLLD